MNQQKDLENQVAYENPFCIRDQYSRILGAFPLYLSFEKEHRQQDIPEYQQEIEEILEDNQNDEELQNFVKNKLVVQSFQNPFYDISQEYEKMHIKYFKFNPQMKKILRFHSDDEIGSVQYLAKALSENNSEDVHNPPWTIIKMKNLDTKQYQELLYDIYNRHKGKIPHFERILLWYPDFLNVKEQTNSYLFAGEGPLLPQFRSYIAIIASVALDCEYIYSRLCFNYIDMGGDLDWIKYGNQKVPKKLQKIQQLNTILAYQPWVLIHKNIECTYLQELMGGDDPWSKSEILHAMAIISYIQMICGFCNSFGILPEQDLYIRELQTHDQFEIQRQLTQKQGQSMSLNQKQSSSKESEQYEDIFVQTLKKFSIDSTQADQYNHSQSQQQNSNNNSQNKQKQQQQQQQPQQQQKNKNSSGENLQNGIANTSNQKNNNSNEEPYSCNSNNNIKQQSQENVVSAQEEKQKQDTAIQEHIIKKYKKYLHQDLYPQINQNKLRVLGNEFKFSVHGISFISEYSEQLSKTLINQINTVKNMTNNQFGEKTIQTSPFRNAIRLYVENLFGYTRDDVDYKTNMNELLHKDLKNFLRVIIKRPSQMEQCDFDNIPLKGLDITEIAHIILLATQTKMEIQMTYCAAALIQCH